MKPDISPKVAAQQLGPELEQIERSAIEVVDLRQRWHTLPEPPQFVVQRYLPRSVVTLFSGHGGAGKSSLALAMAAHVAAGQAFCDKPVQHGRVAFVSLEDGADLVHLRLRRIVDSYQLCERAVLERFTLIDGANGNGVLVCDAGGMLVRTPVFDAVRQAVAEHDLILIDNASDAYGANENARAEVRGFMRLLAQLARENDAAVVLLAHIDKAAARSAGSNGNTYSGSTAWHNSARSRLSLVIDEESIQLLHEKCNLGPLADPMLVQFTDQGVPMVMPQLSQGEDSFRDILPAFEAAEAAGEVVFSNLQGGAYSAFTVLERFEEYPKRYHGKLGRRLAARGIQHMLRTGALVRDTYRKADRKPGSCFKIAPTTTAALPREADQ